MKKPLSLVMVLLLTALAVYGADARKKRVAVLDFEYGTVKSASEAVFGQNVDIGRGMSDLLVKQLVQDGTYSVIERHALDKVLAEQNFSNSDRANASTAAKIGKLLGVDAIIVGSITQFGAETKKLGLGGAGGSWRGIGLGSVGKKDSKAIVVVDARIVDVNTGEILVATDGRGESKRSGMALAGAGANSGGMGAGNVDMSSSNFRETIIGEAVQAAMTNLSGGLIAGAGKLQSKTVAVQGLVAFADANSVVLNVGSNSGLKVGDRLSIERLTQEIKDPETKQVIRRLSSAVGSVEITEVDAGSSVCRILGGSGFKVGDIAKTVTQ